MVSRDHYWPTEVRGERCLTAAVKFERERKTESETETEGGEWTWFIYIKVMY
jgi:hypothetical protein